ncbi:methionine adenosyltransferase domain-containing protein [Candidatus Deianiraea vastatrix]|nr:methionine adenosyltransferase domain-containing protein [Candidatus Deianiraea vastatrix]
MSVKISECVSLGHPDKIADYISCYILDEFIKQDPYTKYALEVQVKDNTINLAGEVSSKCEDIDYKALCQKALIDIGYNKDYIAKWGGENVINYEEIHVNTFISKQSQTIAQGLSGWGDQGIFFGMAVRNESTDYMPFDYFLAKDINKKLFASNLGGLDIKTQVVTKGNDITKIIVAIPLLNNDTKNVEEFVRQNYKGNYELIVNGTGSYISHSSIADCGITGRKLVVDFYGSGCNIGGGSPWTKDGTKADLTLNLYARKKALDYLKSSNKDYIKCQIGCCIGRKEIEVIITDKNDEVLEFYVENRLPEEIINEFNLRTPIYSLLCKDGLFSRI